MQKLNGYIETQYLKVLYNPSTAISNRSRIVYARPLKLYRGISNTLQLRLLNVDQKPVNITGKTFAMNIIDQSTHLVIKTKTGTIANATQGYVDFQLTDSDLRNADAGYYIYSVHELKSDGSKAVVYSNDDYNADGQIRIYDSPYSGFDESKELNFDTMTVSTTDDTSDYVLAYPHLNQNGALHTAQYYLDGYTGSITVQVTLDNDPSDNAVTWTDLTSTAYASNTGNEYVTFTGVYTAVRFKSTKSAGTISKILYRP